MDMDKVMAVYGAWHRMLSAHEEVLLAKHEELYDDLYAFAECHETACIESFMPRMKALLDKHQWAAAHRAYIHHSARCDC